MQSKYLQELKDYYFKRDEFINAFQKVFTSSEITRIEIACQSDKWLEHFLLTYSTDEYYIIHLDSGIIINWYKHLGRTNTCNKNGFNINDLNELLKLLKYDLDNENWR